MPGRMPDVPPPSELLNDGQEEVFSRTDVESGRIEHHADTRPGGVSDRDRTDPELEASLGQPRGDRRLDAARDADAKARLGRISALLAQAENLHRPAEDILESVRQIVGRPLVDG